MSKGLNKVLLIGNLGTDPELNYTQSGVAVCRFPLATDESWLDQNGERKERTEWHRVVAWKRLAEICRDYLHKGSQVYLEGRIRTRSWDGQEGQKRYVTEVIASELVILSGRGAEGLAPAERQASGGIGRDRAGDQDDLPF